MLNYLSLAVPLLLSLVSAHISTYDNPHTPQGDAVVRKCWPENAIPFTIDHRFSESQVDFIYKMIAIFHEKTCIRWVEYKPPPIKRKPNNFRWLIPLPDGNIWDLENNPIFEEGYTVKNFVEFKKESVITCRTTRALIANDTAILKVWLQDYCFTQLAVMHEMLHILGFSHEHQRPDRHCYVVLDPYTELVYDPEYEIVPFEPWIMRYPYDRYSVLHFARSNLIKPVRQLRNESEFLGNAHGQLSHMDLSKILYKFCGGPHYCDVNPEDCRKNLEWRESIGCA